MRVFRTVVGLAIGFGVFVVGSMMVWSAQTDQRSSTFLVGSIGYGVVFAVLAGLTASSLAGRPYLRHAAAVAGLIVVGAALHAVLEPQAGLRWYDLAAALLMAPAAVAGGWARERVARSEA
jgi:fructose-specific phosphotransferase system IIC component